MADQSPEVLSDSNHARASVCGLNNADDYYDVVSVRRIHGVTHTRHPLAYRWHMYSHRLDSAAMETQIKSSRFAETSSKSPAFSCDSARRRNLIRILSLYSRNISVPLMRHRGFSKISYIHLPIQSQIIQNWYDRIFIILYKK